MPEEAQKSVQLEASASVEDVMAALARQSVFDLPTLIKQLVETTREKSEKEDDEVFFDFFVHPNYVLQHTSGSVVVDESGGAES